MRKLKIPLENITVRDIFLDCVANCQDRQALEQCADIIQDDSDAYRELAPMGLADFRYHTVFPGGVTDTRLKEVYENLFVKRKKFYDEILYSEEDILCPICDISEPSTLDHYLPKSVVPTLAVTPCNLVPMCERCNKKKLDLIETRPERLPFHLYFDEFPTEPWLAVRFVLGAELAAHYEVRCPDDWDEVLKARLHRHLELYGLQRRFSIKAGRELAGKRRKWTTILSSGGEAALRKEFEQTRLSEEAVDANSWPAALYRGLEENTEILIQWLNAKQKESASLAEVG